MAVRGYILIEVEGGKMGEVAQGMQQLESVNTVDMVTGPYDIIAPVSAVDFNGIGSVIKEIDCIPGITHTVTCLSINPVSEKQPKEYGN